MRFRTLLANRWARRGAVAAAALLLSAAAVELTLRSGWFAEAVRSRLETEIEAATGGAASIERFAFDRGRLVFVAEGIELRGREGHEALPLLSVRRAALQLRIDSLFGRRIALESLHVVEPRVSITVFDDCSTNFPSPRRASNPAAQALLDLAVEDLRIDDGTLSWNGRPYEAAVRTSDLSIETAWRPSTREYAIRMEVGKFDWDAPALRGLPTSLALEAVAGGAGVELTRFEAVNDAVRVEASGSLADFRRPRFAADYRVSAQIGALARASGSESPRIDGRLEIDGEAAWQAEDGAVSYSGEVLCRECAFDGLPETFEGRLRYDGGGESVALRGIRLAAFAGELSAQGRIDGLAAVPQVALTGAAADFSISRLAAAAGLDALPWNGLLRGEFEAEGSSAADLAASMRFAIEPAAAAEGFPLQGGGEASYDGAASRLEIAAARLRASNAAVDFSGSWSASAGAALAFEALTSAPGELAPLLRPLGLAAATPYWQDLGEVRLDGRLTGSLPAAGDWTFDGKLLARDFSIGGQRWESVSADARVDAAGATVRSAQLSDSGGTVEMQGRLPFNETDGLQAAVSVQGLDVRKAAAAFGFEFPVAGSLTADWNAAGTFRVPEAAGSLVLRGVEIAGEPFDSLAADAAYGENGFVLRNALLARGDAALQASASFAPAGERFEFALEGVDWPLEEFAFLRGRRTPLTGTARFDLQGAGKQGTQREMLRSLTLDGSWEISGMRHAGRELGSWTGAVHTIRNEIHVEWLARMLGGEASGESVLAPDGEAGYSGAFRFENLGAQDVAELLDLPLSRIEGRIDGRAEYAGELGAPEQFRLSGTIDRFEAGLSGIGAAAGEYRISNLFPMRWGYAGGVVRLDSMTLNGSGSDIEIDGTIALDGERAVDVAVDGRFNLVLLESFNPDLEASGSSNLNIEIGGTVNAVEIEGSMEIVDGALRTAEFPNGLSAVNGTIDFSGRRMKIGELRASSGGGSVRLSGAAVFGGEGPEYRLQAIADRVRLRYPTNIGSVFDGRLTLAGTRDHALIDGEVLVSRLTTARGLTFGGLFASLRQPTRTQAAGSSLQNVQLNVRVASIPNLAVETSLVRNVEAEIDLQVVGSAASPSLLGSVGIAQGTIEMLGTRYRVNRGDVSFVNPFRIEPVLNVEMESRVRGVDLALVLSGPLRKLNLNYRSDPPLPFNDLVNLVAVGRAPTVDPSLASQQRVEQQSLIQTGANTLLATTLARPVSQRLQRFFGVSRLKVDPQIGGPEANPNARISTEQQIADDLTLTYSYDLSSAQQQVVRIEWAPDRRWSFIVTRDENGLVGSDFLYKTRLP